MLQEQEFDENIVNQALSPVSDPYGTDRGVLNQIRLLRSSALMEQVVQRLNLETVYYWKGRLSNTELYKNSPIVFDSLSIEDEARSILFEVSIIDFEKFEFITPDSTYQFNFGQLVQLPFGQFRVKPKFIEKPNQNLLVKFGEKESIASYFSNRLDIQPEGVTNILEASMKVPIPNKAIDILNELVTVYNERYVENINRKNRNTLSFLNSRVAELSKELNQTEDNLLDFKIENEVSSTNSLQVESILTDIEEKRNLNGKLELQKSFLSSLEEFILSERMDTSYYAFLPPNVDVGVEQERLRGLLRNYNQQLLRREQLSFSAKADNPSVLVFNKELDLLRKQILEIIQQELKDQQLIINENLQELNKLEQSIITLPSKERTFLNSVREKGVLENLYLYLLQRKEEVAMALAITPGNSRILEEPRSYGKVSPIGYIIYLIAIFGGFFIPLCFLTTKELLNNTLANQEEIKKLTSVFVLGSIPFSRVQEAVVVQDKGRSMIGEMFRSIRANLHFLAKGQSKMTIMVSSMRSGEGKSFFTLNLGMTLALTGKKVVLLGMDLRRPQLAKYMGLSNHGKGITNYLVEDIELERLVKKFESYSDLHLVGSGPVPPNPSELLLLSKLGEMISTLQAKYDYVLIDTPPIGAVSDAYLLNEFVDVSIFLVRQNVTKKEDLRQLENDRRENKLKNPCIVLNAVKSNTFRKENYHYYE